MRADEVTGLPPLTSVAETMLMKLRKGMAASLNAARFRDILPYLPGWKIEKAKFWKPSEGGRVIRDVPGGASWYQSYYQKKDGRVRYIVNMPLKEKGADHYEASGRASDEHKIETMRDVIWPQIEQLSHVTQKKWNIRNPTMGVVPGRHRDEDFEISFEFTVEVSGFLLTSPDGQTYEVYGDYINGALEPHTFESFFKWAVENTEIMDQVLEALQMEAHEVKHDPRKPYSPPPSAPAAEKKVFALLKTMTDEVHEEQRSARVQYYAVAVQHYADTVKRGDEQEIERGFHQGAFIISRCFSKPNHRDKYPTILLTDWKTQVEKIALEEADAIRNMFVFKNTRKLASIVNIKKVDFDQKVLDINVNSGAIEAVLSFTFADGSSFRVNQSTVWSHTYGRYSSKPTFFTRFPTTFHDVVLPDGSKMGMPSEERMNEIFATTKAE